ncbi:MAG: HAMP domain-containing sensor histidine kinase [Polyangiales bacterium]
MNRSGSPTRSLLPLVAGVAIATALPFVAGLSQTQRVGELVVAGETARWRDRVHESMRVSPGPPTPRSLAAILRREAPDGLRYIGVVREDGEVVAQAGSAEIPAQQCLGARPGERRLTHGRVHACCGPVPPRGHQHPPGLGPPGLGPPGLGPPGLGPPGLGPPGRRVPLLVLEFDARASRDLSAARRSVIGAGLAALVALLALGAYARGLLRDREAIAARLEHSRRLASLGEMSAVLAHEIRNPLASLKGHAQLLEERVEGDDRLSRQASRVVTEAKRLEKLVEELLTFARSGTLERSAVSPVVWAREALAGMDLAVIDDGAPTRCVLDAARLGEALQNLARNALEAGGPVEVRLGTFAEALEIEVLDRGPGLAPGEEDAVFEPFHSRKVQGTGLGLAIARRTVALHGGSLRASNRHDGGACFRVRLSPG